MTSEQAATAVVDALESLQIPYMLVGSFSSNFYGVSRLTRDADFVVQFENHSIDEIGKLLGKEFTIDPQMAFEMATLTFHHIIQLVDNPFKIELFHLSDDDHDRARFGRRIRVPFLGRNAWLPTKEDVIVMKLRWLHRVNRPKDREDVRDVLVIQKNAIDWPYVESWCERHGTRLLLEEIRQEAATI